MFASQVFQSAYHPHQIWSALIKRDLLSLKFHQPIQFTDIYRHYSEFTWHISPTGHQALGNKRTDWETLMLFCSTLMTTLSIMSTNTKRLIRFRTHFHWRWEIKRWVEMIWWLKSRTTTDLQSSFSRFIQSWQKWQKMIKGAKTKLPPMSLDLMQEIITGLRVQCLTNWANQAFACKSETFRSLYSHGLLILTKSSKSKNQMVHEQKFKHSLNSTHQFSSVGLALDS